MLVYIEREGEGALRASLEALGEGRRIASALGGPLAAFTAGRDASPAVARAIAACGADTVYLMESPELTEPSRWTPHGLALYAVTERLRPLLVLLADTSGGRDIAPRLAARMGAAFVPEPSIQCGPRGEIVLARTLYRFTYRRRLAAEDLGHSVVATITPGWYQPAKGVEGEAEVVKLDPLDASSPTRELDSRVDADRSLELAPVVVTAGAGVRTRAELALVEQLAAALGAQLGATRGLCERGLAPSSREIGVGARHIAPRLYVVVGASGSPQHLGAVAADAEIVAINSDPDAPIFNVASYGVVGPLSEVIPDFLAELAAPSRAVSS